MASISIQKSDLRYCEIDGESLSSNAFPDFLIVGPQRTGTTWLAENLAVHPEILFSTPKEMFYFNRLTQPDHPQFETRSLEWYLDYFRLSPKERLCRQIAYFRYYKQLFRIKAIGEGTASYAAMLPPETIDEILTLNPEIKVIIMLRNPIKRAWAHLKIDISNQSLYNAKYRTIEDIPSAEVEAFLTSDYQRGCGNFSAIHSLWKSKVATGNLFVGLFDDLRDNPEQLLLDTMRFIGVQAHEKFLTHRMGKVVSPTDKKNDKRALPERYEAILRDLFANEIDWVNQFAGRALKN
ncbi:sulfotransferase domain-containing protein [Cerasicoccus maritimus]|uniref:sulfotransferase domain-containing protein n=1 Tax=Cerasicoccus maritimus TaxID=490089 RepID=UPI00285267BF|nr:sulfotransferase domain-containing protein [Cerasicoccus maritimus]